MSDDRPKPAIPAWQRASKAPVPPADDPVYSQSAANESKNEPVEAETPPPSDSQETEPAVETPASRNAQPDAAPEADEKSAAADMPVPQQPKPSLSTSEVPVPTPNTFSSAEFHTYKQQQIAPRPSPSQPAPPIITYPEFLVQAHTPPPLITPSRIANAVYLAGGIAALIYGARQFLIDPMIDSLTEARHDLISHSQSKVDEMNERLSKLVSKQPEASRDVLPSADLDDSLSETSDGSEFFSRSTGTQTTPNDSAASSIAGDVPDKSKNDSNSYHVKTLGSLNAHLESLLKNSEQSATPNKECQESVNKLRHYLDTLTYPSSAINLWQGEDSPLNTTTKPASEDPIEDLKKEIRGVKGVLLSAKRFPAANRSVSNAA